MKVKNLLKHVFLFLKGMLFGIANIIPGVSGGTMAVITGVYDKLLNAINNLFKKFKESIIFLGIYALGAIVAIFAGFKLIDITMEHVPFVTEMLFAGLILGSLPFLAKPVLKKENMKISNFVVFFLAAALVIGLLMLGLFVHNNHTELKFYDYILLFVCGFLASVAMVMPGISGMMMFQIFGYYEDLRGAFLFENWKNNFGGSILILLPVGLGIILGIFTAAKFISWLLKKYPTGSVFAILGFVLASVVCLFYNAEFKVNETNLDALNISLGIVAVILGFVASYFLAYFNNKKKIEEIPNNFE